MEVQLRSISTILLIANSNAFALMTFPISYNQYKTIYDSHYSQQAQPHKDYLQEIDSDPKPCKTTSVYV